MKLRPETNACLWLTCASVVLLAANAEAQTFTIEWFTIDSGGGTSTGGQFSVVGAIGQPDAGRSAGGSLVVEGGFWSGVSVSQTVVAPRLFIQASGGFATISWMPTTPRFVLQMSDSLSTPTWTDAPTGSANPVSLPLAGSARFFRLRPQ